MIKIALGKPWKVVAELQQKIEAVANACAREFFG
jgi:hypothetical protein